MTAVLAASPVALPRADAACAHCGAAVPVNGPEGRFCCTGCAGAYALIRDLGLERYYTLRGAATGAAPNPAADEDWSEFVQSAPDGTQRIHLLVDGLHCAACIWLIERALMAQPGVKKARISAVTRRLDLAWQGAVGDLPRLVGVVARLGYRCLPVSADLLRSADAEERRLLRAMAVAGFAAANIMLLSVSVWSGHAGEMGAATRDMFHAISALIALPAIGYAGLPFFRSAWMVLRQGRTNMDVPISIGVVLAALVSLAEVARSGPHAYFDAAVTLLFFLLVGRYLDTRARGNARRAATQLLAWTQRPAAVQTPSGIVQRPAHKVRVGDRVLVAAGERIPVDGIVREGLSALDASLLTGETLPQAAAPGAMVYAGAINLNAPLVIEVRQVGEATQMGEMARLMEAAEQGRDRYVRLAERVARWYAPVVHVTALLSFFGWVFLAGADWREALLVAAAVLIITCPCALALAVPVVQVAACERLMRRGILLKSASALERAAEANTIVFDKTGTLTLGKPVLVPDEGLPAEALLFAAGLARRSRHPLCQALAAACPEALPAAGVTEVPGNGLCLATPSGEVRLGKAAFAGVDAPETADDASELWLARPGHDPVRFRFRDALRADAVAVTGELRSQGYRLVILSGDRVAAVAPLARQLGIAEWQAGLSPAEKAARLAEMKQGGGRVMMVGDGLNDSVALAAADASLSPATALDIAQNAADAVFRGEGLAAVPEFLAVARKAQQLARQNLALALGYNIFAVPLAIAGLVTPLIAALAMSSSSLLVVGNALRLRRGKEVFRP